MISLKKHYLTGISLFILLLSAIWSGYALTSEAPIVDEPPHIAAGISYVQEQQYRLNPEHPPLTKLISGITAQLAEPHLPTEEDWYQKGTNEQWRAGEAVLFGEKNNLTYVLSYSRVGATLLTYLGLILLWFWARKKIGEKEGDILLILLASSPFLLAHGHFVTTDVAASFGAFLGIATFITFLQKPNKKTGLVAGIAFGIAQLAKFSLVLLVPTYLLLALFWAWNKRDSFMQYRHKIIQTVLVIFVGYALIVYPTYLALTWSGDTKTQHDESQFLLSSFAGGQTRPNTLCKPIRCAAEFTINSARWEPTRPLATYALGVLMVTQRAAGGNTTYFLGNVSAAGSLLYFPISYLTKETLGALFIVIIGLILGIGALTKKKRRNLTKPTIALGLTVFTIIYIAITLRSSLNIGIRHLFPIIPPLYVLALLGWQQIKEWKYSAWILGSLVVIHVFAGIQSLPHPLSFYNSLSGGMKYGYLVSADSNYDWGQDINRLKQWIEAHPEVDTIAVDLFGGSKVETLLGPQSVWWSSAKGNPRSYGIDYIAISINNLLNATQRLENGEPRKAVDSYLWLQELRKETTVKNLPAPDERVGTSIFIYHLNK